MKNVFITACIVFSFVFTLFSQEEEQAQKIIYHPISKEIMREGIFLTFEEFKNNTPTKLYKLNRDPKKNIERSSIKEKRTGLPVKDFYGSETYLEEGQVFAFCDSQDVYISFGKNYFKIEDFGPRYCVFTNEYNAQHNVYYFGGGYNGSPHLSNSQPTMIRTDHPSATVFEYVIDMNNGQIHRVNNKSMKKKILVDYPVILEKFLKDKMKSITILLYVNEVNELYKE